MIYLKPKLKVNRRCILGEKTNYLLGAVLMLATDCIEVNQNRMLSELHPGINLNMQIERNVVYYE